MLSSVDFQVCLCDISEGHFCQAEMRTPLSSALRPVTSKLITDSLYRPCYVTGVTKAQPPGGCCAAAGGPGYDVRVTCCSKFRLHGPEPENLK